MMNESGQQRECSALQMWTSIAEEHAVHPQNYGPLAKFDGHGRITGPCGDTMEFWVTIREGEVERVTFVTDGCGSSRACGSMTTALAQGKRLEEAATLRQRDILEALGDNFPEEHCALLATNTLRAACDDYRTQARSRADDR